jgi:starch phosphorylase
VDALRDGIFGEAAYLQPLLDTVTQGDYYLVSNDFEDYIRTQERVDASYQDQKGWIGMCVRAAAGMGKFSSDRCIREYAEGIWKLKSFPLPKND